MKNKEMYSEIWNHALYMFEQYFSGKSRPFYNENEYIYMVRFHKNIGKFLTWDCPLSLSFYQLFCDNIMTRMQPCVPEPKKMLGELWTFFAKNQNITINKVNENIINSYMEDFIKRYGDDDIATACIIAVVSEIDYVQKLAEAA